jgi:DNA-binding YbaB/EbfC family protein
MFNKGQIAGLMKQAQAMQETAKKVQEELGVLEVTGESGSGMVKITTTCKHEVKRVQIDPSVVVADEVDMLEDLITAALKDAARRASEIEQQKMGKLNAMMPGGMKLPF